MKMKLNRMFVIFYNLFFGKLLFEKNVDNEKTCIQDALVKSNEVFETFKQEIEKVKQDLPFSCGDLIKT